MSAPENSAPETSAPDGFDLPADLRARIATIVRPLIGPIEIVIRHGQWIDGLERQLDAAIAEALGHHDGLVIAEGTLCLPYTGASEGRK